tara:strand:- start:87849 stop:89282 length:1434 start_codon:yes stop_codon:yes gene_type:complete
MSESKINFLLVLILLSVCFGYSSTAFGQSEIMEIYPDSILDLFMGGVKQVEKEISLGVIFGFGIYFGSILILLIYGLLVCINVRQFVFLWFSLFILFLTVHVTLISGLVLASDHPLFSKIGMINAVFIQISFTRFFQYLVDIKRQFNKRFHWLNYLVYGSVIFAVGFFVLPFPQLFISLTRIILVLSIAIVIWSLRNNATLMQRQKSLILVALVFLIGAGGLLGLNQWTSYYPKEQLFRWGIVLISLHILWISISVLYRVKKTYDSKESLWLDIRKTKKALLEGYLKGVAEEKQRIVSELQNNVILEINMLSEAFSKIPNASSNTLRELGAIKNSVNNVTSELVGNQNSCSLFMEDVRNFVKMHQNEKIDFTLDYFNFSGGLTALIEEQLFRIIQEAVQNIEKYANASQVVIQFIQNEAELILSIEDNGIGFNSNKKSEGIGLLNMQKRAFDIGGTLNIKSSQGNGTSIFVAISLKK